MKNLHTTAGILTLSLLLPAIALAQTTTPPSTTSLRSHIRTGMSITHGVNQSTASSTKPTLITGTVSGAGSTSFTVTTSSTTYTVDASSAKIVRKYGATMQASDIQNGDSLQIVGTVSGSNLTAKTIRDESQQQRDATMSGSVQSINAPSFTITTSAHGTQTVNTTSSTTFKESGQTSVSITNVTAGENVTVSGVWDSTNNTIAASKVTIIVKNGTTSGTFGSANGPSFTLTGKSSAYTVDASSAKWIRRYGAAMGMGDAQSGDNLAVTGTINGTNITAKTIRDESLQAYNGTFVGTITAVSDSSFTLQSKARGTQTINIASTTVFRVGSQTGSFTSLAQGQTATVSGVWDRTESNVTANRITIKVSSSVITGTLQSVSGTSLTVVTASSTTYTIDASKANFYYKNGRKGTISILQTNDQVKVWGTMVTGSTNITATRVQDMSQTYQKPTTPANTTPTPTPTPIPTPT